MKYFIISIDDGTIYDRKVIEILNKYGLKGTFNLNSGLDDFVWYLNDEHPIRRLTLKDNTELYKGHEVASHSLTHPHFTECPGEVIVKEVGEDISNLERMFGTTINTFAFPFHDWDERCIDIIKHIHNIDVIRLSIIDPSFKMPSDLYHVKMTSYNIDDALEKLTDFINDPNAELFVYVSHSYDFEFKWGYEKLEELCKRISQEKSIKNITMRELKRVV